VFSRSRLKLYSSLKEKKARQETGLFIAEGHKILKEGLQSSCPCEIVFVREGFFGQNDETDRLLSNQRVEVLDDQDFGKLAGTEASQGVVGIFDFRSLIVPRLEGRGIVALYDVADPRNLGTILRTADWFGLHDFLIGETCVDIFNEKVIRSTMGSVFHSRFFIAEDLIESLRSLKDTHRILTADLGGADYRSAAWGGSWAVVFSNEARGPSDAILALTDAILTIQGRGQAESLNVASAAAIILASVS